MNSAIRAAVERRRRHHALRAPRDLLHRLDAEHGPLTAEDEPEIERYRRVLDA